MKKVLAILFFLCLIPGLRAEINLQVTDMRCEPNKIMSGEIFHLYATVVNLSEEPVDTQILLCVRTAPDGFYGYVDIPMEEFDISLPGLGEEEIDWESSFRGEDERFEYYFLATGGDLISDYCPLQLGECGTEVKRIEMVGIDQVRINVGKTDSLLAAVYPGSAPQEVTWEVENPDVIKIIEYYDKGNQGVIFEGIAAGETDITVVAVNGMSATAHVRVDDPIRAESITLNTYEIKGEVGDTFQLEAYTLPESNEAIVLYNSNNEKVATVGLEDGLVTITGPGTTEIYAWATPSVGFVQAICAVTGVTSGIDDIDADPTKDKADVYRLDGTLIVSDASPERINKLPKGCYILRYPHKTMKIIR